jgi:hypothetical protein
MGELTPVFTPNYPNSHTNYPNQVKLGLIFVNQNK